MCVTYGELWEWFIIQPNNLKIYTKIPSESDIQSRAFDLYVIENFAVYSEEAAENLVAVELWRN
jgi:hypothetical protein